METVDIFVEYASGMTITDRATFITALDQVCVSERLASVLREFSASEAPHRISAQISGRTMILEERVDGRFHVAAVDSGPDQPGLAARLVALVKAPTKEQRQQFGRFMHTLSVASIIGAIGFWHSTSNWDWQNVLCEANLWVAAVITFYVGIISDERRLTMGFSFAALVVALALGALGLVMDRNGRKADRERGRHSH